MPALRPHRIRHSVYFQARYNYNVTDEQQHYVMDLQSTSTAMSAVKTPDLDLRRVTSETVVTNKTFGAPPLTLALIDSDAGESWREAQHTLFQLANFLMALTFLVPFTFLLREVITRCTASLACVLLVCLSAFVTCQPDTLAWYVALLCVNVTHLIYTLFCKRPATFQPELEDIYAKLFKPLAVSRDLYSQLMGVAHGVDMTSGASYSLACVTRTGERISIIVSGRMEVTAHGLVLHTLTANQFVDSLEYDRVMSGQGRSETFQVTIRTVVGCRLVTWPVRDLVTFLNRKPFMQSVFACLVGKDIVYKLNSVQDTLARHPRFLPLTRHHLERCSLVRWKQHMSHSPWRPPSPITLTSSAGNGHVIRVKASSWLTPDDHDPDSKRTNHRTATPVGRYSPSQVSLETTL